MTDAMEKNRHLVFWTLLGLALLLRGLGIASQPALDDEAAAAFSADNYLQSGHLGQVMWYHPPLRNYVVALSGVVFGEYSAWGLRGGSILLGSLSVPLLGYLGYALFRNTIIAALAAFFLCIDPLHIALSRQAFQESTTPFFILAGTLASLHGTRQGRTPLLYLAGLCFGLASASKWHGIFPWVVCAAVYLFGNKVFPDGRDASPSRQRTYVFVSAFMLLPLVVYLAAYLPWIARGHSITEFIDLQLWLVKRQYIHKATFYAESFLSRHAWLWFLWPTAWVSFVIHQGASYLNIAVGNFLVWVMTLPSLYAEGRKWLRTPSGERAFLLALFLASYLPLVLTSRSVYVFSAPAVIPFAFLLIASVLSDLLAKGSGFRVVIAVYLGSVIILSLLMYPLAAGNALAYPYLKPVVEIYNPHRPSPK